MSSTQSESSGAAGDVGAASAPGARLRQARERRGDSIAEVAQALKLAPRQVDALERGDYEALPGPAFVRGFMRNYARYLNLDPEPLIADTSAALERLRVDLSPVTNAEGDLPTAAGRRRARKSTGAAALLAGALVAVLLLGWYFDWFETTPALPVAAEPQARQVQPQVLDAPPAQPVLGEYVERTHAGPIHAARHHSVRLGKVTPESPTVTPKSLQSRSLAEPLTGRCFALR